MSSLHLDGLVIDLDGVLYRGSAVVPGAPEAVARLRERGLRLLFATNNSRATAAHYVAKLGDMDFPATEDEILTSAAVTAETLVDRGLEGTTTFLVGGPGIEKELRAAGFDLLDLEDGSRANLVVVGADPDVTFAKLRVAADAVRAGATFIATNPDPTFPTATGLVPGAGAVVAAVAIAAGRDPEVMGKPNRPMMDAAARRLSGCESVGVVGDQPLTDLAGARYLGWTRILVLSGVTDPDDPAVTRDEPDLVLDSIADLPGALAGE